MSSFNRLSRPLAALSAIFFSSAALGAAFTPGNIVVQRFGDGAGSISANATATFLEEYTPTGTLVQTIPLPTTALPGDPHRRCTVSGTGTSEGKLSLSSDGRFVIGACYDAALGTASITGSSSATINRVIFRVDADGIVDTTTALTDFPSTNPRSATSTDGTDLWMAGNGAIRYTTLGGTTSVLLATGNQRTTQIFGGQLYTALAAAINTVGTGIPTSGSQALTSIGLPTTPGLGVYGYFFADLSDTVPGLDTVYVANDTAAALSKYSLNAGAWEHKGTVAGSYFGLAGIQSGNTVTLYAVNGSAANNSVTMITDASGYDGAFTGTATPVASAGSNRAFRGVALVPTGAAPSEPELSIQPALSQAEGSTGDTCPTVFAFTVTASAPVDGDLTFNFHTADGTAVAGDDYTGVASGTAIIADGTTTGTATVNVTCDDDFEDDETFTVTLDAGTGYTVGTTAATSTATILNDDAAVLPVVSITGAQVLEGNAGQTATLVFEITTTGTAAGDISFDIAVNDGTAEAADNDYVDNDVTGFTISAASVPGTVEFEVTVNGDDAVEDDETLSVVLGNATNAVFSGGNPSTSAIGTILNDDFPPPPLGIADVSAAEGHIGTRTFSFVATLGSDPGMNTVTFTLSTADGTATVADGDYQPASTNCSLTGTQRTCTLDVLVNGDLAVEADETFFVNVGNVSGANVVDGQAVGTITNDDVATIPIGEVQGTSDVSPRVGQTVTVAGIVTAVTSGGFWIQDSGDGNPDTSDGIYVFRSGHGAQVGQLVRVTGPVVEYFHLTELSPTLANIVVLDPGPHPLPAPVVISFDQNRPSTTYPSNLERFENMRVHIPDFTVTAPNRNKTGGEFYGVVTGQARPFREPGIPVEDEMPNPLPATPYNGPMFDNNPELLAVNNGTLTGGSALLADAGSRFSGGITGVMDYNFEKFRILPDPGTLSAASIDPGSIPSATAVSDPVDGEFTVAAFNVQLLKATDPNCNPESGGTAAERRRCLKLHKVSQGIVEMMKLPDVVALIEVGDFNSPVVNAGPALDALVARVNADAIAGGHGDPQYVGLIPAAAVNEQQATAFLIKTAPVNGQPRVQLDGTLAEALREYGRVDGQDGLDNKMYCPDGVTPVSNGSLLDRAPLALRARVAHPNGDLFPVTVVNLHLKSLANADSNAANTSDGDGNRYSCAAGAPFNTLGERYRAKRQQGAEFVARMVEMLQTQDPDERLLLVGDFNAYEFNDGYADVMATIRGETYDGVDGPYADNLTIVPGDGADLVTRNLSDLYVFSPPEQWYSYTFDGHAQQIDHELANDALLLHANPVRLERPRINADFGQIHEDDVGNPLRSSDHDPVVGYFKGIGFGTEPSFGPIADASTLEDTASDPIAFTVSNVLGCTTSVTASGSPALADASFSGDDSNCQVVLTPGADVEGPVAITLTAIDPDGDTTDANFTLNVTPVNDAPVITNAPADGATEGVAYSYTPTVSDPDGPQQNFSVLAADTCGGVFTGATYGFTPASPVPPASCTVAVQVCDGGSPDECDSVSTLVTITAVDSGDAIANDDGVPDPIPLARDSGANAIDVLANDVADPDDGVLAVTGVSAAAHGTTAFTAGGVTYAPDAGYCGADSFTYTVNGGDSATVFVVVQCDAIFADGFED